MCWCSEEARKTLELITKSIWADPERAVSTKGCWSRSFQRLDLKELSCFSETSPGHFCERFFWKNRECPFREGYLLSGGSGKRCKGADHRYFPQLRAHKTGWQIPFLQKPHQQNKRRICFYHLRRCSCLFRIQPISLFTAVLFNLMLKQIKKAEKWTSLTFMPQNNHVGRT